MAEFSAVTGRALAAFALVGLVSGCSGFTPASGFGGEPAGSPIKLADRAAQAGDYATSANLYQQAFEANPNSVDAMVGLGRAYAGLGQYARAEQALLEASRRRPNDRSSSCCSTSRRAIRPPTCRSPSPPR